MELHTSICTSTEQRTLFLLQCFTACSSDQSCTCACTGQQPHLQPAAGHAVKPLSRARAGAPRLPGHHEDAAWLHRQGSPGGRSGGQAAAPLRWALSPVQKLGLLPEPGVGV